MRTTLLVLTVLLASFSLGESVSARMAPDATVRQSRRSLLQQMRSRSMEQGETRRIQTSALPHTWADESIGVSVRYADGWEMQEYYETDGALTLVVMFLSPAGGSVRANANLVLEEIDETLTLDEYTRLAIANEEAFLPNFRLRDITRVPLLGHTAARVRFTAGESDTPLQFEQVWFLHGTVAHVWTFADSADRFQETVGTFHHMLDTILLR